ncbi:MAG: insulinase family protein [Gammaproteobacteria bacterium]|nr:insulinase family protein [Gammaproteobacteria bacterium]
MKYLIGLTLFAVSFGAAAVPEIQHWRTENGARVYFVEAHEIPILQLSIAFDAGSARDPASRSGLAHLTSLMLDEGAGKLSSDAIANRLDSVGAEFGSNNGRDMSVVDLRSLSDPKILDVAVGVFAEIVANPKFPEDALGREKDRALVRLAQKKQSPQEVVQTEFYASLFSTHPYANPAEGDEAGVKALTRADLVAFHKRYFTGGNAVVAIVGDLTRRDAERIAATVVGGLPAGSAPPPLASVKALEKAKEKSIEFPSSQSHVLLGQTGITRGDPDYFPLYIGNYVLGGSGLVSRLSVEIREKRGLAYSVYSYFLPMRELGPYLIGLQTRNDQVSLAVAVVQDTVERFVAEGPTEAELEAAKKNLTGGFPLKLDSTKKIAANILNIAFYGLPLDYLNTYTENIERVTRDQVRDAFKRRVDPKRLVRVIVGDQNA